ncbi:hypothetical protein AB0950_40215 [Streptomyces sp. NPDC007189]|uniref:effector-associated constant component EACC1 n=1 Tax=Streptomyces sp. NPDC007189 TaxID=3154315 RepID=UPI003453BD58
MLHLLLSIAFDPEFDPESAERLTRQLRAEIAELDVESIAHAPAGASPDGAKGSDAVTLGAVVVALSASSGVFTTLIETLRDWLGRHSARHRISLTIDGDSIELERASAAERQELIDAYVRRHTGR